MRPMAARLAGNVLAGRTSRKFAGRAVPEDFVSLCFAGDIGLTDGERRARAGGHAPIRPDGRLDRAKRPLVPQMQAENGKQRQSTYIATRPASMPQHTVRKAGQRRM